VFADAVGFAGFALDPLPDLRAARLVEEDQQVLELTARQLALDPAAAISVGQRTGPEEVNGHFALLRQAFEPHRIAVDRELLGGASPQAIPAELLDE
jgi:hypothetical protein